MAAQPNSDARVSRGRQYGRRLPIVASPRGAASNRLSMDDWIKAGYAILAAEGMKALKIDRSCSRLGVTKGSFYWHFDGMPSYRTALVESWGELREEDRRHIDDMGTIPPRERLSAMMTSLVSPRHRTLERAMREWARSDESVATSVRAADRRLLRAVRQAFLDYGFDQVEADVLKRDVDVISGHVVFDNDTSRNCQER